MENRTIGIIGLGYVGMPLAISFAKHYKVIGFDLDTKKIESYKNYIDPTNEIGSEGLKNTNVYFTSDPNDLSQVDFYIVTVPTPIKQDKTPDLFPIEEATKTIGKYLNKGDIVVYESTVYPGVTEEICMPILSSISNLKSEIDFKVGYSPERINPGDKKNTVESIIKIVSGNDDEALEIISSVYSKVIKAGIHKASSIKVAESAKVVENAQRDINIAFMNEIAQVFNLMDINTNEVLEAMNTKWNALNFYPGLVGGHCIGVDPYYFIYQAENIGFHSQIISSGRKINNYMSTFVINNLVKELLKNNGGVNSRILVVGATFKEDTPDFRNSKVIDMIEELKELGFNPLVVDPYINDNNFFKDVNVTQMNDIDEPIDVLLYAVDHSEFRNVDDNTFISKLNKEKSVIVDLKNRFKNLNQEGLRYWSL